MQEKKNLSEVYNPIISNKGNTPKEKRQEWARGWEEGCRSLLLKAYLTNSYTLLYDSKSPVANTIPRIHSADYLLEMNQRYSNSLLLVSNQQVSFLLCLLCHPLMNTHLLEGIFSGSRHFHSDFPLTQVVFRSSG